MLSSKDPSIVVHNLMVSQHKGSLEVTSAFSPLHLIGGKLTRALKRTEIIHGVQFVGLHDPSSQGNVELKSVVVETDGWSAKSFNSVLEDSADKGVGCWG
ncbi:hypothetical protein SUGI_1016160 [Cryptomeria japonica]|nr:hypothetical protein SUGI_1016160 [Cryptomeria japonica]